MLYKGSKAIIEIGIFESIIQKFVNNEGISDTGVEWFIIDLKWK